MQNLIVQAKSDRFPSMFHHRVCDLMDPHLRLCLQRVRRGHLRLGVLILSNPEHRGELLPINPFRTPQSHEKKTSNNSFYCVHLDDYLDDRDRCGHKNQGTGLTMRNSVDGGLLLVYDKLHPVRHKNIEENMWVMFLDVIVPCLDVIIGYLIITYIKYTYIYTYTEIHIK